MPGLVCNVCLTARATVFNNNYDTFFYLCSIKTRRACKRAVDARLLWSGTRLHDNIKKQNNARKRSTHERTHPKIVDGSDHNAVGHVFRLHVAIGKDAEPLAVLIALCHTTLHAAGRLTDKLLAILIGELDGTVVAEGGGVLKQSVQTERCQLRCRRCLRLSLGRRHTRKHTKCKLQREDFKRHKK